MFTMQSDMFHSVVGNNFLYQQIKLRLEVRETRSPKRERFSLSKEGNSQYIVFVCNSPDRLYSEIKEIIIRFKSTE